MYLKQPQKYLKSSLGQAYHLKIVNWNVLLATSMAKFVGSLRAENFTVLFVNN